MFYHPASLSGHEVTTQKTKFRVRIHFFQLTHEVGSMQISRSFACNEEVAKPAEFPS